MRTAAASKMGSCKQKDINKYRENIINIPKMCEQNGNKPGIANNETTEHCSNSSTRSSDSDCSGSSTNELGGGVNVPADGTGLEASQCDLCEGTLWHHSNSAL